MSDIKKLAFVFGDVTMTLTEADLEAVFDDLAKRFPKREPTSREFADACMERIKASARPTRTVLHN